MAKVTGPLYSISASGKLADAMVYFGWKGVNVVRGWVKPANPKSASQGDQRIIMGGTGRAVGAVKPTSNFAEQLVNLGLIPGGQTKQSFLVKFIIDHYLADGTAYAAMLSELTSHTAYAGWTSGATAANLVEFDLDYATIAAYNKALGLYLLAKAGIALGFTGTPYSVSLSTWTVTQINLLVADLVA